MLKTIDSLGDLAGKKVLVRSDLNVPLDGTTITDDGRVRASVPTIQKLLDAGASVIVLAHLGRPAGTPEAKYSLAPAAARLSELLGKTVTLADDLVGESAAATVAALAPGDVAMLENVRFDARETSKVDAERESLASELRPSRMRSYPTALAWFTASKRRCTTSRNCSPRPQARSCRRKSSRFPRRFHRPRASLRRGARRVQGFGQAWRNRESAHQGGSFAHRRRNGVHVPRCQGVRGGYLAARGRPDRHGQGLPCNGRTDRRGDRAANRHHRGGRVRGRCQRGRGCRRRDSLESHGARTSARIPPSCSRRRSRMPRRSSGTAPWACSNFPHLPRAPKPWRKR